MRYIEYDIIPVPYACIHRVIIKPGNISGTGTSFKNALDDALRYEKNNIYKFIKKIYQY